VLFVSLILSVDFLLFVEVAPLSWDQWLFCIAIGLVSLPLGVVLRLLPVPDRHYWDIIQFWNTSAPQRHTVVESAEYDGEEIELVTANLLPYDAAMEENRAARLVRKERDLTRRKEKAHEIALMREREAVVADEKAAREKESNDLK
jgi:hypothetical protein